MEAEFIESAKAKAYILQMPRSQRMDFQEIAPEASKEVRGFIAQILYAWHSCQRLYTRMLLS